MKKERDLGIEILRIILGLSVIILHTLGHGNLLSQSVDSKPVYLCLSLFESLSYPAVNCFILITGYYISQSSISFIKSINKILPIIFQMIFYGLLCYIFIYSLDLYPLGIMDLVKSSIPYISGIWWFPIQYIGLLLIAPWLNHLIDNLDKRSFFIFLVVLTGLLCFPILGNKLIVNNGMSLVWFILLFLWGGYLARCQLNVSSIHLIMIFAICIILLWITEVVDIPFISSFIWSYASIPVLVAAICEFLYFKTLTFKISKKSVFLRNVVLFMSSMVFPSYLLSDNLYMREWFWGILSHRIEIYANTPIAILLFLIIVLLIFSITSIVEMVRRFLFSKLEFRMIKLILNK